MPMHFGPAGLRLMTRVAGAGSLSVPSTRIKNIEDNTGIKLLHHTSQGVTLLLPGQLEHLRGNPSHFQPGHPTEKYHEDSRRRP